jgi:hypothetical protein
MATIPTDGVEADVVDQSRLAGDAADVDVHVVTEDFGEGDADRIGGRRFTARDGTQLIK